MQDKPTRGRAGQWSAWYTTPRWRAIRAKQLRDEPLCAYCLKENKYTEATVCDHLEPHRGDPIKFWAGPFQSLCQTHHSSDKQREEKGGTKRSTFTADGRVVWD